MTEEEKRERALKARKFYRAEQEAGFADASPTDTPQTRHPAYRLAFRDTDFLLREELRPVRFQLELLKPEMLLEEAGVGSTLVMYGSARIPPPEAVETALAGAKAMPDEERIIVERLAAKAKYYREAYNLARLVSEKSIIEDGKRQFVVTSGGGPSIMEAANKGASDAGAESIGLNIVLPHEQAPNRYVTPYLSFQFHYFALRKMHFLLRARAVAVFPGGFGTFDEFFELLTLIQTGKMKPIPILLFGKEFWCRVIDWDAFAEEGTISKKDLDLFRWCETADEAWGHIAAFYRIDAPDRPEF
ncbi:lysine decarboxylase [Altererythrobacter salegens]|uniref:AMP nucleosidase n=1 Tax=Croceibacterium salegens TaxID=1737568 RepID=A0A6I4SWT4_9SPHN|nr:LOG family protein [Croceibacterium salegens]MXO59819.1 lysine decarboxylase [Croceibacterium salegens]